MHKTIRIRICEEKQKGDLAVSSLCQCSKRIIIKMAVVFNVFSFEIRRQLLKLILFEVSVVETRNRLNRLKAITFFATISLSFLMNCIDKFDTE